MKLLPSTNPLTGSRSGVLPWATSVVLGAVAIGALWQAHDLRSSPSAQNKAVVNTAATSEVQSEVTKALVGILSYDYSDPGTTSQAASAVLTGKAKSQYDELFSSLQERAPGQKLVLSATVQVAAVKELSDRDAVLLVFVDQSSQRATDKESTVSAAQLSITAKKYDTGWKISDLSTL
jgi:Mce-associated membrane protein